MKAQQRYISDELTHFAGTGKPTHDEQYKVLSRILESKTLVSTSVPFGNSGIMTHPNGKLSENNQYTFNMVCFCDIPLGDMGIHIKKYTPFGLSFKKNLIVSQGGSPVYYIPKKAIVNQQVHKHNKSFHTKAEYFDEMHRLHMDLLDKLNKRKNAHESHENVIQNYTLFQDLFVFFTLHIYGYIKFFDHTLEDNNLENYYFEREWRIPGSFHFKSEDVQRILLPKTYVKRLREDLPEYYSQITFTNQS
jgi:hypothetical protein